MNRRFIAVALLCAGAVVVTCAGVFFWLKQDQAASADGVPAGAQSEPVAEVISQLRQALRDPGVGESARRALAGESLEALSEQLREAGLSDVLDVRVFSPPIEEIETGSYPAPDFAAVQMLLAAGRQDVAPAEVHYPGSDNENLTLAAAVPAGAGSEPAGYLLVRVPLSLVADRLASVEEGHWLALVQDETVLAGAGDLPDSIEAQGRAVPGSRLRLVAGRHSFLQVLPNAALIATAGGGALLILAGLGVALRRDTPEPVPARQA